MVRIRLQRRGSLALVALCMALAAPAWAETYYFCEVKDYRGTKGLYYTPIMATSESIDETETGFAFGGYLDDSGRPTPASVRTGCTSGTNLPYLQEQHAQYPEWYPGIALVDWPDPPVPSEPVEELPSGPFLVVEDAETFIVPPEELAAQALAEQRQRAAALAKALAANARRDAELDAALREALERARRRGRMQ